MNACPCSPGRRRRPPEHRPHAELPPLPEPPPPGPTGLRSLEAHRKYLLSCVSELPPFRQHLLDALDLSLCEEIVADLDLPRFDNSAMDGYAVRAADVAGASPDRPVSLPVVGEIAAGSAALHRLSPGTAMKIMTGAPLPEQADAIVPYENSDRGTSDVRVFAPSEVDQHVRHRGEDIEAGTQLFGPATCSAHATSAYSPGSGGTRWWSGPGLGSW